MRAVPLLGHFFCVVVCRLLVVFEVFEFFPVQALEVQK